jgi:hypothetical protein
MNLEIYSTFRRIIYLLLVSVFAEDRAQIATGDIRSDLMLRENPHQSGVS